MLDEMLAEHEAIDEPMRQLSIAATELANNTRHEEATVDRALRAIAVLLPPLEAHLEHEEVAALPIVRRVMTQVEWETFEKEAWASRRSMIGTARFLPWMLDGIQWTPTLRARFAPARRMPTWGLAALSSTSRKLGTPAWRGTTASAVPSPLVA